MCFPQPISKLRWRSQKVPYDYIKSTSNSGMEVHFFIIMVQTAKNTILWGQQ